MMSMRLEDVENFMDGVEDVDSDLFFPFFTKCHRALETTYDQYLRHGGWQFREAYHDDVECALLLF